MKFKTIIFNEELAEEMGWLPAILLHHITFWVEFNKRNKNEDVKKEGVYWMYQTAEDMAKLFPRMTDNTKKARDRMGRKAIEATVKKLENAGLIKIERFIVSGNTKINHYRPTDKGKKYAVPTTFRDGKLMIDYDKIAGTSSSKESVEHFPDPGSALVFHSNKNKKKNFNEKTSGVPPRDIAAIISVFEPINVSINYGNMTERAAAADLIRRVGFPQALMFSQKAVEATQLRLSANGQDSQFIPMISSPSELNRKFTKLANYLTEPARQANQMPDSWRDILD